MQLSIPSRFAGPPAMGHGGYVSGLLADRTEGGIQVTLRRPIPLDVPLDLDEQAEGHLILRHEGEVLVESQPSRVTLEAPAPPDLAAATAAQAGSPSLWDESGVHPICFGCGASRPEGDGLRIFAGPVGGDTPQVAGPWRPGAAFADPDGLVARRWVLAALDCPGAFAFIADGVPAGLLGRITFEQRGAVAAEREHIVTGWQAGTDGKKLLAGTALWDLDGTMLAIAQAVWFPMAGALPTSPGAGAEV